MTLSIFFVHNQIKVNQHTSARFSEEETNNNNQPESRASRASTSNHSQQNQLDQLASHTQVSLSIMPPQSTNTPPTLSQVQPPSDEEEELEERKSRLAAKELEEQNEGVARVDAATRATAGGMHSDVCPPPPSPAFRA